MNEQFGVGRIFNNPMRPGKFHIRAHLAGNTICGNAIQPHRGVGRWDIERALAFAKKMGAKYPKSGFCKHCLRSAEKLRSVLDRLAEL